MYCSEARRKISGFINDELSLKDTVAFQDHVRHCASCRDETEVQLLIHASVDEQADGDLKTYDLRNLLEKKTESQIRYLRRMRLLIFFFLFLAAVLIGIFIFLLLSI